MTTISCTTSWDIPDAALDGIATDLLTTAAEGGIQYWAHVTDYKWDTEVVADRHVTVLEGDDGATEITVTVAMIREAITKVVTGAVKPFYNQGYTDTYAKRVTDLFTEITRDKIKVSDSQGYDYDADDADNVLQIAAFGEIVYG